MSCTLAQVIVPQRSCAQGRKSYTDLIDSGDECEITSPSTTKPTRQPEGFHQIRETNSTVMYCGFSNNVCVAFLKKQKHKTPIDEYIWIPQDALKHDAQHNKVFLEEINEYVEKQSEIFWDNPEQYIFNHRESGLWSNPRQSSINYESPLVKAPFACIHFPNNNISVSLVFIQFASKCVNGGTTYNSLKVVAEELEKKPQSDTTSDAIARCLVRFVYDSSKYLSQYASLRSSSDVVERANRIKKLMGLNIVLEGQMLSSDSIWSPDQAERFIQSIQYEIPRNDTHKLALKVLRPGLSCDSDILEWYQQAHPIALQQGEHPHQWISNKLEKMEATINRLSVFPEEKTSPKIKAGVLTAPKPEPAIICGEPQVANMKESGLPFSLEGKRFKFFVGSPKPMALLPAETCQEEKMEEKQDEGFCDIEASSLPFSLEKKRFKFVLGSPKAKQQVQAKNYDPVGIIPTDISMYSFPSYLGGRSINFVVNQPPAQVETRVEKKKTEDEEEVEMYCMKFQGKASFSLESLAMVASNEWKDVQSKVAKQPEADAAEFSLSEHWSSAAADPAVFASPLPYKKRKFPIE